ncbi:MAG: DUF4926 domain-containing protein [candidate division WOR-3 bacterium]
MPDLFDVVELITDIPERGLHVGMQGTIVHCHPGDAYEVEFTNEAGETLDFLALRPEQFIVIWRAKTKQWVPAAERIAALMARLPEEVGEEILDFARFLYSRKQRAVAGRGVTKESIS